MSSVTGIGSWPGSDIRTPLRLVRDLLVFEGPGDTFGCPYLPELPARGPGADLIGRKCFEVSHRYPVPCDQAGESCPLARSLVSGQRERVVHLHHTSTGESYENI